MTTRPDIQAKRDAARRARTEANGRAFELEQRAASLAHTIATLDEERMRLLVQAMMIREKAR